MLGVFFGGLRLNRCEDQPLVRLTQLDVEPFDLQLGLKCLFSGGDRVLSLRDQLRPGAIRRFTPGQRPLLHAHRVVAGRRLLFSVRRWVDCGFFVRHRQLRPGRRRRRLDGLRGPAPAAVKSGTPVNNPSY